MLVCVRSRAGSSSSTYATWVWPRRGCRHSLAQWPSLPQLWQASSRASFWLPATPPRALPSARPRALEDAPEEFLDGFLLAVGVITELHHLLLQSIETESKVINVLTWLEG
jgi:hypothetical protein